MIETVIVVTYMKELNRSLQLPVLFSKMSHHFIAVWLYSNLSFKLLLHDAALHFYRPSYFFPLL